MCMRLSFSLSNNFVVVCLWTWLSVYLSSVFACSNKSCGWGCQFHHMVYTLMIALADGRLFVAETRSWSYFGATKFELTEEEEKVPYHLPEGYFWEKFFEPVSSCGSNNFIHNLWPMYVDSKERKDVQEYYWRPNSAIRKLVSDKIHQVYNRGIIYWVPHNMKLLLERFHPDPPVWFVGQLERVCVLCCVVLCVCFFFFRVYGCLLVSLRVCVCLCFCLTMHVFVCVGVFVCGAYLSVCEWEGLHVGS
jgi:Alpha-(1,6)-fucosyltransferase N- and catalytic domains